MLVAINAGLHVDIKYKHVLNNGLIIQYGTLTPVKSGNTVLVEVVYPISYTTINIPIKTMKTTANGTACMLFSGIFNGQITNTGFTTQSVGSNYGIVLYIVVGF